jgi:5-methylcytosine-specific restriction endonuclease McrA
MLAENSFPALLLNADFQPVHMHPLSTVNWQEAIKAVISDRVTVIEEYDQEIHSANQTWRLPSVIALKEYVSRDMTPTFSRYNVYLRDNFTCQYCGQEFETKHLTFDHVLPRHHGGISSWTNVVAACSPCNHRKGSKLTHEAKMFPINKPKQPTSWELYMRGKKLPHKHLHETWRDYIYWDAELEA